MYELKDSKISLNNLMEVSYGKDDIIILEKNIPITNDILFKSLFGREEYIKFPCKLLSYIEDISYEELLKKIKIHKK